MPRLFPATLRRATRIAVAAVSREVARVALPPGLTVSVTVRDVTPTHPTRQQLADDPAVDLTQTKFIGGAELAGEVRDANGQRLATVTYRHFPQTVALRSASPDPWADARLAIDQFAVKLAAVCHDLGGPGVRAPQRPRPHTAAG